VSRESARLSLSVAILPVIAWEPLPIALNGRHHIHFYPGLERLLQRLRPDVLHIDEESFNLATYQAMRCGVRLGARCCFYNYANIDRRYPPPFSFFEHYNLTHANHAFAANREASDIIRRHGYRGHVTIVPQVGVDPDLFAPDPVATPVVASRLWSVTSDDGA
jgi:glycosyltransferase involved in cell wall biosynthesis